MAEKKYQAEKFREIYDPSKIVRPLPELAPIIDNLPIPFLTQSPYILLLLLILFVLFLLIVLL